MKRNRCCHQEQKSFFCQTSACFTDPLLVCGGYCSAADACPIIRLWVPEISWSTFGFFSSACYSHEKYQEAVSQVFLEGSWKTEKVYL